MSTDLLSDFVYNFLEYSPRIIAAIILILIGRWIAKKVGNLVKKIIKNAGLDKYGNSLQEIEFIEKANINLRISDILGSFLYVLIFLFFIITAIDVLHLEALSELTKDLIAYLPSLFTGILTLLVGTLLCNYVRKLVNSSLSSLGIPSASLIATLVFYMLFISVAMSALNQAKFDTEVISTNFTVILGGIVFAFAIGYGLASRQLVSNQLNSHYLKKDFQVGQRIKIGDVQGVITELGSHNLILENEKGKVVIPFKKFSEENVVIFH